MNPGKLNKRITIKKLPASQDSFGDQAEITDVSQLDDIATVWASIMPLRGRDLLAAEKFNSEITHRIQIRYRPGITAAILIIFNSRTFKLIGPPINVSEQNVLIELMCKELVQCPN